MMRVVLAGLAASVVIAVPARADHVAGATYRGTHSGGGTVEFTLSGDGKQVVRFGARDVKGDTCSYVLQLDPGEWLYPDISGDEFDYDLHGAIMFHGRFPSRLSASGTLRLYNKATSEKPACDSGTLTWTARTTADGDPPPVTPPQHNDPPAKTPPRKPTYPTSISLRRAGSRLTGKLGSSSASCRSGRTVTLKRGSKRIKSVRTKRDGSFSFARTRSTKKRSVYVIVSARTGCLPAASKRIKG